MKKLMCIILALAALSSCALADDTVLVVPGEDDLTQAQVETYAAAFFAEKCGMEESVLRKAEWTIQFGHSTLETAEDAVWSVSIRRIEGHPGVHALTLTGPGELLCWEAHGAQYTQACPGLLDSAKAVRPLPTDIQAEAVIALIREEMVKQGFTSDAAALTITPTFAYDEHFNSGYIPVWLVGIEDGRGGQWKAAVSHKGGLLSLGLFVQDYQTYTTPDEQFWPATFPGEAYFEEQALLNGVLDCTLSHAEKAEITARWRVLVERWMAEHPYYLNNPGTEYTVTFVNVYGVPDEKAIPQETAEQLARDAVTQALGGEAYHEARVIRTDYLVNDPERPVWYVFVGRPNKLDRNTKDAARKQNPAVTQCFGVTIDARSGEVYTVESFD